MYGNFDKIFLIIGALFGLVILLMVQKSWFTWDLQNLVNNGRFQLPTSLNWWVSESRISEAITYLSGSCEAKDPRVLSLAMQMKIDKFTKVKKAKQLAAMDRPPTGPRMPTKVQV